MYVSEGIILKKASRPTFTAGRLVYNNFLCVSFAKTVLTAIAGAKIRT
ncbi:MAG: hypothetical protein RIR11_3863 [Bacteroidota bacterium]|jgi:hypothetical protein